MKKNTEHNYIFIIGILIAGGIAAYKGMDFDLWTILWIFFCWTHDFWRNSNIIAKMVV